MLIYVFDGFAFLERPAGAGGFKVFGFQVLGLKVLSIIKPKTRVNRCLYGLYNDI